MKVTITSIELKGPLKFFALSSRAMQVVKQLKATDCKQYKAKGFWTKHYTMTLWNNETELKDFARSGAHLEAMKASADMAKEIRTLTIDASELPSWNDAIAMLQNGKILTFNK